MTTTLERRTFLATSGSLALAACLPGCATDDAKPTGGTLKFDTADAKFADLAKVGGVVATEVGGIKVLLIRTADTTVVALDRMCSHERCDLAPDNAGVWDQAAAKLKCTCHGSQFGADGKVLAGPAKSALKSHSVTFDGKAGTAVVG
jgi:cytochrome b6-f complex iron-sulfur subunit